MGQTRDMKAADWGLLIGRLGFAGLLIGFHGWARFGRAFGYTVLGQQWTFVEIVAGLGFPFPAVFAVLSAFSESIGALLLGLGLFTRFAALALAINMGVATFSEAYKGDPFELPGLYFLLSLIFLAVGGGRFSIDRLWRRGR